MKKRKVMVMRMIKISNVVVLVVLVVNVVVLVLVVPRLNDYGLGSV